MLIRDNSDPARIIIDEELRILARVSSVISEIGSQVPGAPDFQAALLNLRDQIAEAKPEDIAALVDQMMRINAIAQRYGRGRDLPVDPRSPYFAHLRLEEHDRKRDVLIGKRGYIDRYRQVQIVDWRNAPVSRIYYRYEEGDDFEEPVGEHTLEGLVLARRSLTIEQSRLRRIACPQGTFIADDNGSWSRAEPVSLPRLGGGQGTAARPPPLARGTKHSRLGVHSGEILRSDKHLPEIAALIDPAQFDLITRPESGLIVLQGGAGSGKTTVALHRVAYLNFAKPQRFRPDRMLVVVLTEALVRYVERVLPSLGVKGVKVMTARSWFEHVRRRVIPSAPGRYNVDTPAVVLRFKKHPMLLELLEDFIRGQVEQATRDLRAAVEGTPDADTVIAKWQELGSLAPVQRCTRFRTWLGRAQHLTALSLQQAQSISRRILRRLQDILSDWAECLTDRALLFEASERLSPGAFNRREIDSICSWCAQQTDEVFAPVDPSTSSRDQDEAQDVINPYISLDGLDERSRPVAGRLDRPDDSLLLYLAQLKHGSLRPPRGKPIQFEHLVVDEAQDLSAIETRVLLDSTSSMRSITLAGDVSQRIVFDNAFEDWETLLARIGMQATANTTLQLGYRSTEQIMELARQIIGKSDAEDTWTPLRSGTSVQIHRFTSQGQAVALLAEALRSLMLREPRASVACIARHPEQARSMATALSRAEVPNVRHVVNQEFAFKPGIEVTDVTQVKGLEFDYVILLDVNASTFPINLESRNMLYIAATRAAHQLWILCTGQPSPLLPGVDP